MTRDIFISHSSKDEKIVKKFIDLILHNGLDISIKKIFCTSADGTKIPPGDDWRNSIKDNLRSAKIVVFIITTNYKESEICLNELGAAWIYHNNFLPFIILPVKNENAGIMIEPKQILKLNNRYDLDRLKDKLQDLHIIDNPPSDRWTLKKEEFLEFLEEYININPFPKLLARTELDEASKERDIFRKAFQTTLKEKNKVEKENVELRKLKEKKEIEKLDKKLGNITKVDEFKVLVNDVKESLELFSPIVRGIIFADYAKNDVRVNADLYPDDVNAAIARKVIFVDEDYSVNWETHSLKDLHKELSSLKRFMENINDESFFEWFDEKYSCEFDIDNLDFWKEIFEVNVSIS